MSCSELAGHCEQVLEPGSTEQAAVRIEECAHRRRGSHGRGAAGAVCALRARQLRSCVLASLQCCGYPVRWPHHLQRLAGCLLALLLRLCMLLLLSRRVLLLACAQAVLSRRRCCSSCHCRLLPLSCCTATQCRVAQPAPATPMRLEQSFRAIAGTSTSHAPEDWSSRGALALCSWRQGSLATRLQGCHQA